jgi:molecular chaperone DnaK (HSP70)
MIRTPTESYLSIAKPYLSQLPFERVMLVAPLHYYTDNQLSTLQNDLLSVGIQVEEMLPEAVSVAYAYDLHRSINQNILVLSIGYTHTSASILRFDTSSSFNIIGNYSNASLGGKQVNQRLATYFIESIQTKHRITLPTATDDPCIQRIEQQVEQLKLALSSDNQTIFSLSSDDCPIPVAYEELFARKRLEYLNHDLLERIIVVIQHAIDEAEIELSADDIHHIALSGGSANIPKLHQLINKFFGREIIQPNEDRSYEDMALFRARSYLGISTMMRHYEL